MIASQAAIRETRQSIQKGCRSSPDRPGWERGYASYCLKNKHSPYRKVPTKASVRRYGSGLNVTEMIASQAAIRETRQSIQKAAWHPVEDVDDRRPAIGIQLGRLAHLIGGAADQLHRHRLLHRVPGRR
jgi:hypothetical protein